MTVLGCIADDFTGATDLAGLLARSGARVKLRIGVPSDQTSKAGNADIEVIALKIRTVEKSEAIAQSLAALAWLQSAGAQQFYWKYCSTFDSTDEGNIGPVSEALMDALGAAQTVYCPAFPENGRSVYMGNLFVGQQLLHESPMKDHPLTPMRESNLVRLLDPQTKGAVGLIDRLAVAQGAQKVSADLKALAQKSVSHVVFDAVADDDLKALAEAALDLKLLTGGSALAMPLPNLYAQRGLLELSADGALVRETSQKSLILSGSCSAMTRAQVAAYQASGKPSYRLDPIQLSENGTHDVLDWLAQQDFMEAPLVFATAEPADVRRAQESLGTDRAGAIVEEALAQCALEGFARGARRFVVAGGETSGAVTQAFKVNELEIGREIAPGVPWTFAKYEDQQIALALKSGNFGQESFFDDALQELEGS